AATTMGQVVNINMASGTTTINLYTNFNAVGTSSPTTANGYPLQHSFWALIDSSATDLSSPHSCNAGYSGYCLTSSLACGASVSGAVQFNGPAGTDRAGYLYLGKWGLIYTSQGNHTILATKSTPLPALGSLEGYYAGLVED